MSTARITEQRNDFGVGVIGGPTVVIDYAGLRLLSDPTFDPPGDFGAYFKVDGPAVQPETLGAIDAVLLSHVEHFDNFDHSGRALAATVPTVITGPRGAATLANGRGLAPYDTITMTGTDGSHPAVRITAVPAQHGPADGERNADGDINAEVVGFVLQAPGRPTVYLSGDNASVVPTLAIAERFPDIDLAVLHCGAARVPAKFAGRPLTLTAERASDVAQILDATTVIPVHCEGWSLYDQGPAEIERAFADAGIEDRLRITDPGYWTQFDRP